MKKITKLIAAISLAAAALWSAPAGAQEAGPAAVVVFWEEGFAPADTAAPSRAELSALLPGAKFVSSDGLPAALAHPVPRLLVLAFGSAFPEEPWLAIRSYLEAGGNLLVLGGKPFARPAYRDGNRWKLRTERLAFAKKLLINEFQETPGSDGLEFQVNPEVEPLELEKFPWRRGYSLTVRLSDEDLYPRQGSFGGLDARLAALAWGVSGGRRLSAPVVRIDHLKNRYAGGRWILLSCELPGGFFSSTEGRRLVPALAQEALRGAEDFNLRPSWPVFLPGEPPTFDVHWQGFAAPPEAARLEVQVAGEGGALRKMSFPLAPHSFPFHMQITLPADDRKGLHVVTARLYVGSELRVVDRTGYWLRDEAALRSGLRVSLSGEYFALDGRPQLIAGTTYMASDVQREFFLDPNPYVWDRDMAEMHAAGLNMLRTGWWSGWDLVMKESGVAREAALRSVEAYLLTARKYELPVQFTFFAFAPEVLGGQNPYLDPESLRRQKELVAVVVERFHDVPFLIWDIINEPSFSNPQKLWLTRPNGDVYEQRAWSEWLKGRYPDRGALADAWKITTLPGDGLPPLPEDDEFSSRAPMRTREGSNTLKVPDYYLFAQQQFRRWVEELRGAIRSAGSQQLITVGQDEGGGRDRLSPVFYGDAIDFTVTHPWWQDDALLLDSLVAKLPGKAMLIQEVGVQRSPQIDDIERRSPEDTARLLERKLAIAAVTSAGAIQWLWHTNAYMKNDNEAVIGALRSDATEKPEALTLRRFAEFAAASRGRLSDAEPPKVAIVTSQAFQYSALNWLALEAQAKAVRALEYSCRVPATVVAENRLAELGKPQLVILPSPHALTDEAWERLLQYVEQGGNLLITGSIERDLHWQATARLQALGLDATPQPLLYRQAQLDLGTRSIALSFDAPKQQFAEALATADGKTFHELRRGRGTIFVVNFPVELAEGLEPAVAVYGWVLQQLKIDPLFSGRFPSAGVLIRRAAFRDAILYAFASESGRDEEIDIRDRETGAAFHFRLGAQRARLLLLTRRPVQVIAAFGNE